MRAFVVEIPGAAGAYVKRRAQQKYTIPHEIARQALNLLATVDEEPDYDVALVNRKTGEIRHLVIP